MTRTTTNKPTSRALRRRFNPRARVERQYLERLARDIEQDLETLAEVRQFEQAQVAASVRACRGLRLGVAPAERETVAVALSQLTARRTLRLRRATCTDLPGAGNLWLIRNARRRESACGSTRMTNCFGDCRRPPRSGTCSQAGCGIAAS